MNKRVTEGDLAQDLGDAVQAFGEAKDELEMQIQDRLQEIARRMQSAYGQARDHAADTLGGVDSLVSERPYLSMAIAVAAGAAVGFLLGVGRPKVIVVNQAPTPRAKAPG
jgi:ElaB/YqjD/DUF883 family membrane-anchored ribosome-binding protein